MGCQFMLITGVVFLCGGAVFAFISSGTNYWKWYTHEPLDVFFHSGLYRYCYQPDGKDSRCEEIEEPKGYEIGTRSLIGAAISQSLIAIVVAFIHSYKVSRRTASKGFVTANDVLTTIAVILLIIANIVYGANFQDDDKFEDVWDLGTSFYLNIVAIVGLIIGSILIHLDFNPAQQQVQPVVGTTTIIQHHHYPGAQPGYGQPMPPAYGQPAYGQPAYGQPAYGQPAYGQPAYGQPVNGQPSPFATAASGQPAAPDGEQPPKAYMPPPPAAQY